MFYIYIIYSESADKYYIGHTNEPVRRLSEHKTEREWERERVLIISCFLQIQLIQLVLRYG
jgi:predicted GIY-YIG superfamily endonuclease